MCARMGLHVWMTCDQGLRLWKFGLIKSNMKYDLIANKKFTHWRWRKNFAEKKNFRMAGRLSPKSLEPWVAFYLGTLWVIYMIRHTYRAKQLDRSITSYCKLHREARTAQRKIWQASKPSSLRKLQAFTDMFFDLTANRLMHPSNHLLLGRMLWLQEVINVQTLCECFCGKTAVLNTLK